MAHIVSWWDELRKTWARMEPSIFPLITNQGKGTIEPSDVCANKY